MRWLVACLIPASAWAQTVTVEVRHYSHTVGLSNAEARQVYRSAVEQIGAELGVKVRLVRWRTQPGSPQRAIEGFDIAPTRFCRSDRADVCLRIEPKFFLRGYHYSDGAAVQCGPLALARVGRLDRFPGRETDHARLVIAHELAHTLGARHTDEVTAMHAAAQSYLEGAGWHLGFGDETRRQVRRCIWGKQ